jgi:aminoglycoside 3-N-acetyltransferase
MESTVLFESPSGPVTSAIFREALLTCGAQDADVLYVHSGLNFGTPPRELRRSDLLNEMTDALVGLGVHTICMPTFTFSFCNGLDYNVQTSRSHMGALNEHFRKREDVVRSIDPLMSVAAIGRDMDLVTNLGVQSTGANSTFDKLSRKANVKFLFLGVHPGDCFTYMHYLEWKAGVPYRYDRDFSGSIIDSEQSAQVTKKLFVRYNGVYPNDASYTYGDSLEDRGDLSKVDLGDSNISCVSLEPAETYYLELLDKDPNYFITKPFNETEVNTDFNVKNMVAL